MTPYEDKTLKDSIREEGEKLKHMSVKDRLWYIWEYYKIPIITVIAAGFFIFSIGSVIYNNRFGTALSCLILNSRPSSETDSVEAYFNQGFRQYIGLSEKVKMEVDCSMTPVFEEASRNDFTYAQLAKITALIHSRRLDVMIGNREDIEHFGRLDGFTDLNELLPADVYDKTKEYLFYVTNEETGERMACGLFIGSTDFCNKTGLTIDEPILSVVNSSTHTDTAVDLIRYVLGL